MLRTLTGSAWAMMEYGWYPLLLFITTPWFLHQLGTEQYGYWMLLTAIVSFGGVLNVGTGAATIKAVSAGIGRTQEGEIAGPEMRASLAIAIWGGAALATVVLSLFWFGSDKLLERMDNAALVQMTGVFAALLIWIEQLDTVFSSAMKGAERFGQAARIEIAFKAIQIIAAAVSLVIWPSLLALYLVLLTTSVLRLLAKKRIATRLLALVNLHPSLEGARGFIEFAKWGWLQGIGSVLYGAADRVLIGSLLGASSLAYYSIASQLAMQVHAASAAGLSVIFPKISRNLESNENFSLRRVTTLTTVGNLLLSSALALALIVFGQQILDLWIGPDAAGPTAKILPWLVLAYWLLSFNVVPYYVLLGVGRIRFVGLTVLFAGISGITAIYLGITNLGFEGTPLGRGVYALASLALLFPLLRHFSRNRKDESRAIRVRADSAPGNNSLL